MQVQWLELFLFKFNILIKEPEFINDNARLVFSVIIGFIIMLIIVYPETYSVCFTFER